VSVVKAIREMVKLVKMSMSVVMVITEGVIPTPTVPTTSAHPLFVIALQAS
jgi:hypothetical protein